ncbi:MAG TPA: HAD family hydrolase, partial [Nakamurella sp.]|nr:HAD family hydrolase [Nakamurella sp.]
MSFTVGFDLDMTLIDPRPGMVELFGVLASETQIPLDGSAFVTRLGPPLTEEFARYGVFGEAADALVARYRELYAEIVIP